MTPKELDKILTTGSDNDIFEAIASINYDGVGNVPSGLREIMKKHRSRIEAFKRGAVMMVVNEKFDNAYDNFKFEIGDRVKFKDDEEIRTIRDIKFDKYGIGEALVSGFGWTSIMTLTEAGIKKV